MKINRPFWWMIIGSSICTLLATFGFRELLAGDGESFSFSLLLFSISMGACGVFGFAFTLVAGPIRERVVSVPARILLFGASIGVLWSTVAGGLIEKSSTAGIVAGALTGVAVSFALYKPLIKNGRFGAFFLGIVSLPAGAFCFGVCKSLILEIMQIHYETLITAGDVRFKPLALGAQYAVFSIISAFVVFLIPLAILTTFALRAVVLYKADGELTRTAT